MESERKAFNKDKHNSVYKLQALQGDVTRNANTTAKMESDLSHLGSVETFNSDGTPQNPVRLHGLESADAKDIGARLAEIKDKVRTDGHYKEIGELYGFKLLVKTEAAKDLLDLTQNKFYVQGRNGGDDNVLVKYTYNSGNIAADPQLAASNFLNALAKIPQLIEQSRERGAKLTSDLPILQQTATGIWKKEDELRDLKGEVAALERKIALSLKPVDQSDQSSEQSQDSSQSQTTTPSVPILPEPQRRGVSM